MKLASLCLIAMLAPPTLAFAQAQPDLAFYGARVCAAGTAGAQVEPAGGETFCLDPEPVFGGTAITAVSRDVDAASGQETAIVTLGQTASTLLYAYTYANPGQRMGVTLDGRLVSAIMITDPVRSGQLTVYGLSHAQIAALVARFGENAMKLNGTHTRSIWPIGDDAFGIIDQTKLPHELVRLTIRSADEAAHAIKSMQTRGAPLIGLVGAYGLALAVREDASDDNIQKTLEMLAETRPTAINLKWALWRMRGALLNQPHHSRVKLAWAEAAKIADEDVAMSEAIGFNGLKIIEKIAEQKPGRTVNILTHCNAGWLATVDYGTALAPIYMAHDAGIPVHVWVDETRPRNQGAALTAFELGGHGVKHAIVADNAGGHYMQAGQVDLVIVGTDRVTANGDVANKIGTYLKALAAKDNNVPFYVALPSSTIDWTLETGAEIPIEERSQDEVLKMQGRLPDGSLATVEIAAPGSAAANPGFDVTPARLVTGFITERGTCAATPEALRGLFPKE